MPAIAVAIGSIAGCGSSESPSAPAKTHGNAALPTTPSASAVSGSVTVFAASSLQEAFTTLANQFEVANPGVHVKINFGASSTLAQQINHGAPADVFASAAIKNMEQVVAAGGASTSADFAENVMEIAVPANNPAHVTGLPDLAKNTVKVAVCAPQVPCGATAAKVFANAKLAVKPVTLEADVKSTLTKVELGEVDAGMVYVTDVRAAGGKVKGIAIPADVNASTRYPIASLADAPNPSAANAFVAYVLSAAGRRVLAADGFESP